MQAIQGCQKATTTRQMLTCYLVEAKRLPLTENNFSSHDTVINPSLLLLKTFVSLIKITILIYKWYKMKQICGYNRVLSTCLKLFFCITSPSVKCTFSASSDLKFSKANHPLSPHHGGCVEAPLNFIVMMIITDNAWKWNKATN